MNTRARDSRAALRQARRGASASVVVVLSLAAAAGAIESIPVVPVLAGPVALLGAVAPVVGYRGYLVAQRGAPAAPDVGRAFVHANLRALAVTTAVALAGCATYTLSGDPMALLGVLSHLLLAGAIWPTEARIASFLEARLRAR